MLAGVIEQNAAEGPFRAMYRQVDDEPWGLVKVEPPFVPTDELLEELSDHADVRIRHYFSTGSATILEYDVSESEYDEIQAISDEARIEETLGKLISTLSMAESDENFNYYRG